MLKSIKQIWEYSFNITLSAPKDIFLTLTNDRLARLLKRFRFILHPLLAILVGCLIGILAGFLTDISSKWAFVIIVVVVAIPVVLVVNDLKKLILIAIVVDLVLGIDIAIQNQGWHNSGPTGYMVSLTTIVLIIGYALWMIEKIPQPHFYYPLTIPALLYIVTSAISLYYAPNQQLWSFGLFLKIHAFLMFFYLINHITTWPDFRLVITTVVICLLLEASFMVLQYFSGASLNIGGLVSSGAIGEGYGGRGVIGARVAGTLAVPASAALYLNSMMVLTFGAYLAGNLIDQRLALLAMSVGVIALIGTSSRGGWGSFAIAMIILLVQSLRTGYGRKVVPFFLIGTLVVGLFFGDQIQKRFVTVTEEQSREQLAYGARNVIRAFPFGVGDNNYDQVMSDKYAHPAWIGAKHTAPHNTYLSVWAELGLQGLIAFVLLIVAVVWQSGKWLFKKNIPPNLVVLITSVLAGITVHVVHMRSETFTGRPHVLLFWFMVAMGAVINRLSYQKISTSPTIPNNQVL